MPTSILYKYPFYCNKVLAEFHGEKRSTNAGVISFHKTKAWISIYQCVFKTVTL